MVDRAKKSDDSQFDHCLREDSIGGEPRAFEAVWALSEGIARQHYYPSSDLNAAVKVGHVFIGEADAAR